MKNNILITGGTGLIGKALSLKLVALGFSVINLTRHKSNRTRLINQSFIDTDYHSLDSLLEKIDSQVYAIINLAGANVSSKRWNEDFKKEMYDSRINITRFLIKLIQKMESKPKVFLSSSAVGIYGNRGDEKLTEDSANGDDFLAKLCIDWESEAIKAEIFGLRVALIRTGIVLSKEGGALAKLITPFNYFVGGPLGNGKQFFPWIDIDDIVNIYVEGLNNQGFSGAVNAVSPNILRMKEFCMILGENMNRPSLFYVPKIALKILFGEGGDSLVASQNVIPQKLRILGYKFLFPELNQSLTKILK